MTQEESPPFTREDLEHMNEKTVKNQFFTPDHVYIDLSLFKDFAIGAVYADAYRQGREQFERVQNHFLTVVKDYQIRTYDTSDPFLASLGYSDDVINALLTNRVLHDQIFLMSPSTNFLQYIIRHTIRNQNHSGPAAKHTKRKVDKDKFVMDGMPITYYINTFPLHLSTKLLEAVGREFGEALGVDIRFIRKDPGQLDASDWKSWLEKIECYYLNSLGRFTGGDFIYSLQGNMALQGVYLFARKRFEKHVMAQMKGHDFSQQVGILTAHIDMLCDFTWIPNGDLLLVPDDTIKNTEILESTE